MVDYLKEVSIFVFKVVIHGDGDFVGAYSSCQIFYITNESQIAIHLNCLRLIGKWGS